MANILEDNYGHLLLDLADYLSFNCEVITVGLYGQVTKQEHLSVSYQQIDLGQGVTLDMVLIPGGIFLRGSPQQELERAMEEGPQQEVIIPVFWMGKYPITQAQWKAVAAMGKIAQDLNPNPSYQQGDHLPVENISWYDAMEFCARLSAHTDQEYTLPSEAQWEYACRAGTITPFHFGETITTEVANYAGTEHQSKQGRSSSGFYGSGPKGTYRQKTTDVGSFPPNAFGLYDMHGNVWEWCLDHWHDNYRNAPGDGTAWISSDLNADRVLRGGSWVDGPAYCRAAFRFHYQPDYRLGLNGLRIVRLPPKTMIYVDMVRLVKTYQSSDKKRANQGLSIPSQTSVNLEPEYSWFRFEVVTVNPEGRIANRKLKQTSAPYQTLDLGQGVSIDMVLIPGGTFMMGSPNDTNHQHQVTLTEFWMGKYPVTQAQYQAIMGNNPARFKGDNRPVEKVSWYDAMEFCDRLSKKLGQPYTLPSEAQWEYACRAGTTTPFHFGETLTTDLANYDDNSTYGDGLQGIYWKETTDVGSFPPNGFGLYDMHGNVWEWCLDHWHDNYQGAPNDGSAWVSEEDSFRRIRRGGSWDSYRWNCRCVSRLSNKPSYRYSVLGFRVVSVPPKVVFNTSTTHIVKTYENNDKKNVAQNVSIFPQSLVKSKPQYRHFRFEVLTVNPQGQIVDRQQASAPYETVDLGQGVTLDMVLIPGGSFMMDSPDSEVDRSGDEGPRHQVTLTEFWMGKYPVTQAQYQAIMGNNPARFKGDNRPVEKVSWYDAMEFCDRLSKKLGQPYTLPSEAQWEYACRAGTTTPFHFGETITTDLANYDGNYTYGSGTKGIYRKTTTDVGSFPPNGFGLYDMHGNVWEWCLDHRHSNYEGAPVDGSAWVTKGDSSGRIFRGGSWFDSPRDCRCAYRAYGYPVNRFSNYGLRVVSVPPRTLG